MRDIEIRRMTLAFNPQHYAPRNHQEAIVKARRVLEEAEKTVKLVTESVKLWTGKHAEGASAHLEKYVKHAVEVRATLDALLEIEGEIPQPELWNFEAFRPNA